VLKGQPEERRGKGGFYSKETPPFPLPFTEEQTTIEKQRLES